MAAPQKMGLILLNTSSIFDKVQIMSAINHHHSLEMNFSNHMPVND